MKYLCLDIGNVIFDVNLNNFLDKIGKLLNLGRQECWDFLENIQKLHDVGLVAFENELSEKLNIKSKMLLEEIMSEWNNNTIKLNNSVMYSLSAFMSKNKVKIAFLSNVGGEHAKVLHETFNHIPETRDAIKFFSNEVGARKPTYLYFKTFLDIHPEFKESIFIDDRTENLIAAEKFGFKSYHFALDKINDKNKIIDHFNSILAKLVDI